MLAAEVVRIFAYKAVFGTAAAELELASVAVPCSGMGMLAKEELTS
jgi:hypothetical protein